MFLYHGTTVENADLIINQLRDRSSHKHQTVWPQAAGDSMYFHISNKSVFDDWNVLCYDNHFISAAEQAIVSAIWMMALTNKKGSSIANWCTAVVLIFEADDGVFDKFQDDEYEVLFRRERDKILITDFLDAMDNRTICFSGMIIADRVYTVSLRTQYLQYLAQRYDVPEDIRKDIPENIPSVLEHGYGAFEESIVRGLINKSLLEGRIVYIVGNYKQRYVPKLSYKCSASEHDKAFEYVIDWVPKNL